MGIIKFDFNVKKAYQVIKYIYNEYDNRKLDKNNLAICRMIYFVDKNRSKPICGGTYLATSLGIIHEELLNIFSNKDTMNILNSIVYNEKELSKEDIKDLNSVIDKYCKYTNKELIEILCKEDLWINNYKEDKFIIISLENK